MGTRDDILDLAERYVQTRGYNGFSYRDIADEIGIKTASIHYHFRSKAELGEAVAKRYVDRAFEALDARASEEPDPDVLIDEYVGVYRAMLHNDRMCLCGMLAAEIATLPEGVALQSARFMNESIRWLTGVFSRKPGDASKEAMRLLALLEGALLIARSTDDLDAFDRIVMA